jgi:uncharacterized protein (DUF58 family)
MNIFSNRAVIIAIKLYVCVAIIVTAILSSPITSLAAVLVLLIYLFFQWRPINNFTGLISAYFVFFAVTILLDPITNYVISTLVSLPVLVLITNSLIITAISIPSKTSRHAHGLTQVGIALSSIATANLAIALFIGNIALLLASSVAIVYLSILISVSFVRITSKSIKVEQIQQRMIAGNSADLLVDLHSKTNIGGVLYIESTYNWLKIHSPVLLFRQEPLILSLSISPLLSGPSEVSVQASATDCWGLTRVQFRLSPIQLYIIPRARYAGWLAKRYLDATKPGMLPLISNVSTVKPQYGYRRGIEYYGSQLYQPGDELKNIDWKHSAKYNKMITKEFVEFHGQPAVLLINLAVGDAEEADELAQKTITTAISLAREQIPTVIAAYDQHGIKLVTATLQPRQMVVQSLEITREITMFENPTRYLYTPDISRLRANIGRLNSVEGDSSKVLSQLLNIEYSTLMNSVMIHPATKAINKALDNANIQSTIVVVSMLNHDANAIAANSFLIAKRGYAFVVV